MEPRKALSEIIQKIDDLSQSCDDLVCAQAYVKITNKLNETLFVKASASNDVLETLKKRVSEAETTIAQNQALLKEKAAIEEQHQSYLETLALIETLKKKKREIEEDLDKAVNEYNTYVRKIDSINQELEELRNQHLVELIAQYNERYGKDKEIFGELTDPTAFKEYVDSQLRSIEKAIDIFERKIKELVEDRSKKLICEVYHKKNNANETTQP